MSRADDNFRNLFMLLRRAIKMYVESHNIRNARLVLLNFDMVTFLCADIELNGLYVIKDKSGIYHRVKVTSLSSPGSKGVSERATVFYVDTGRLQRVATEALLELPDQFHTFAYQAVELYACRVKPHDNDLEWIPRSETFMSERIFNRELHGHVVLSLGKDYIILE